MDKIIIKNLPVKKINGRSRKFSIVKCPDCGDLRQCRTDSIKHNDTTCCRTCINLRRPTKSKEQLFNVKNYYRTKKGLLAIKYQHQVAISKERKYTPPAYTQKELYNWAVNQPLFHELFSLWKQSGYARNNSPSIDRIDDYVSYTFDNIQLMSWKENNIKGNIYQITGKNTKNSFAVDQYSLKGEFIERFYSIISASRELNINAAQIGRMCNKTPSIKYSKKTGLPIKYFAKSAGGYLWKFSSISNDNSEKTRILA